MNDLAWLGWAGGVVMVLAGLAGCLLPAIPGLPLIFLGALAIAWAGDFQQLGAITLGILAAMALLGMLIDFVAGVFGAKVSGASSRALLGAALGSVVSIFFGLPGLVLGPFIGAALGEWQVHRDAYQAGKVGLATLAGLIAGTVAKLAMALAMIGVLAFGLLL